MHRIGAITVFFFGLNLACAGADQAVADEVGETSTKDFADIRNEVETLRGKKFIREVPVVRVSKSELRSISDRELDKQYPRQKLGYYEELNAWLDFFPPDTSLKEAEGKYLIDQVAGLYDSDTKKMCIPSFDTDITHQAKKTTEKKLQNFSPELDNIVLAHEFTHALEDQHWPIFDTQEHDLQESTDRDTAKSFLVEGSATSTMIEAIPSQLGNGFGGDYFAFWNLIHSSPARFALKYVLSHAWKDSDALVNGVPESLARMEAMPYSFGYSFCTEVMDKWGLDGLDYIYEHLPASSEQVIHPRKCWEWRDFPVQIDVPETLPTDWKRVSQDSVGEAGMAVLFGCKSASLNFGLEVARGWDGDYVGLFKRANGKSLLLWASAWDSTNAAARFANACVRERQRAHEASISTSHGPFFQWNRPDGRAGIIVRQRRHVILIETDDDQALLDREAIVQAITFTEPLEDAARAAENSAVVRFNPLLSWQKDSDYTVTRSLCGLLTRHDRNSIGASDSFLLGLLAESRRTTSLNKWKLCGGLMARHESEARRGCTKTTFLPWGILASHESARLPQSPEKTIARTSLVWGLGAGLESDGAGEHRCHLLPFGLLFSSRTAPGRTSVHILATGFSKKRATDHSGPATRLHILGLPIWTSRSGPT